MEKLIINGGRRLSGEIDLQGAKNSILPILAAAAAVDGISVIHNCPRLSDVDSAINILRHIGCRVTFEGNTVTVDSSAANRCDIPASMMREMRSSIIFLGALISRFGKGKAAAPGGCEIGLRPIDLHISSLREMGVVICENGGIINCEAPCGTVGCRIALNFPSVGATENIMLASLNAKGETIISNAAREPEIKDLADFLNKCGADIRGAGQSVIRIICGKPLHGAEHRIIPDRIAASMFMAFGACTGGKIFIRGAEKEHLAPVISAFEEAGCRIMCRAGGLFIAASQRPGRIRYIRTMPYPGFPTDSQALIMAVEASADGTSVICENIFENRFRHVPELIRMGADIRVENGCVAVTEGKKRLHGSAVSACDLRGGTALVAAALGAEGETVIENVYHIRRGCQCLEEQLCGLGADIRKIIR